MRLRDPATGKIPPSIRQKELAFARTLPTKENLARLKWYKGKTVNTVQELDWSARGPINVGGKTRALAIDIANDSIILAGGVSGGLWRSTDAGSSWGKVTEVSELQSVTCIAQDRRPGHTNSWYYGTGENWGNTASTWQGGPGYHYVGNGIFKSTDNGITWNILPATASNSPETMNQFDLVYSLAFDSSNSTDDIIYAACFGGIFRSSDGGASWSVTLGDSSGVVSFSSSFFTDVAVSKSGVVYATMSQGNAWSVAFGADSSSAWKGIYRSADGIHWTNILPGGWPSKYNRVVLDIAPSNEDVLYFLGETPGSGVHVVYAGLDNYTSFWKYTYLNGDGSGAGGNWADRSANLPVAGSGGTFAQQRGLDIVVKVKPDTADVVFIGGVNMFRSTDGFASTSNTTWIGGWHVGPGGTYTNHHADEHAIVFLHGDPSAMLSGSDGGVHRTSDDLAATVVWDPLNTGYMTTQFYAVAIDHATPGNDIIVGGAQDNGTFFTSASSASPWKFIQGGDGGYCAIADRRSSYYTSSQNGVVYRHLLDSAGNESASGRVDPTGGSGYLFIAPFVLDPTDSAVMYLAGGTSLWRNTALTSIPLLSTSTTSVGWSHLTNSTVGSGVISSLGVSTNPANRVYYGTSAGSIFRLDSARVGNPSPTNVTSGSFPAGGYVSCVAVDPTNADRAIAVFSNYSIKSLFYTTDAGSNWTDVSGNLEEHTDGSGNGPSCRWAKIVPSRGYFVATSTGAYSAIELNGASTLWALEGAATMGNVVVDMIDARASDGRIVAATHGNGIYSAIAVPTSIPLSLRNGWNLVSVPNTVADKRRAVLFPGAASPAFAYEGSYTIKDSLFNRVGYWLRFGVPETLSVTGNYLAIDSIPVNEGWNLVGSISAPVAVSSIVSVPPGITTSRFFGYAGGYFTADHINPGEGYWVKANMNGSLIFSTGAMASPNAIRIVRTPEFPPSPPTDLFQADASSGNNHDFRLEQNYPNPFNPSTVIRYSLPAPSHVILKIFNMLGQQVAILVDENEGAGFKSVEWDAGKIPSGVYTYRLEAETFSETRKLVLLR
jgi:photosystem II stability/assembly factor-like uncharacterized protein